MSPRAVSVGRAIGFALPGAIAMLLSAPILTLPFFPDPRGLNPQWLLVALPIYVGLAAAPGYLYSAALLPTAELQLARKRWWIRISLWAVVAASTGGIVGGLEMFLFLPPALASFCCALYLLWCFERKPDVLRKQGRDDGTATPRSG